MSRLADYFVVVSYGDTLESIDPSELADSLGDQEATGYAAVAAVGGAGGPAEVEASSPPNSRTHGLSPQSYTASMLSPIQGSPAEQGGSTPMHSHALGGTQPASALLAHSPSPPPPVLSHSTPAPTSSKNPLSSVSPSPTSSGNLSSPMPLSPTLSQLQPQINDGPVESLLPPPVTSYDPPTTLLADGGTEKMQAAAAASSSPPTFQTAATPAAASVSSPQHNNQSTAPPSSLRLVLSPSHSHTRDPSATLSPQFPPPLHPALNVSVKSPLSTASPSPTSPNMPFTPRSLQSFTERVYKGKVVDRFPAQDHRSVPFPPGIAMFCIPEDITLSTTPDMPLFYYFAATGANGVRLYGACLKFFEPLPEQLAEQVWAEEKVVQENKRRLAQALLNLQGNGDPSLPVSVAQGGLGASSRSDSNFAAGAPSTSSNPHSSLSSSFSHLSAGSFPGASPTQTAQAISASAKLYSYCLLPPEKRPTIYASKCLCLLSTYAFLRQFRSFLTGLYRLSLTPSPLPLERLIGNFMLEVPVPPLGEIKVQYTMPDQSTLIFARPPPNDPFAFHHFPVRLLFECLDFAHALLLIECILTERRILLLSTKMSSLTLIAESCLALIYPFQWQHVYIPLLPKSLIDFLHAPMPFIIGTHPSYLSPHTLKGDVLDDLVIVHLDHNRIEMPGAATRKPPPLPHKEKKKLWQKMKKMQLVPSQANQRGQYEQKLMDTLDLAFSNAPLPHEVENAENLHCNLSQLLSVEVSKNRNATPRSNYFAQGGSGSDSAHGSHTRSESFSASFHARFPSLSSVSSAASTAQRNQRSRSHNLISPSALANGKRANSSFSSPSPSSPSAGGGPTSPRHPLTTSLLDSSHHDMLDYLICSAFFRVFVSLFKDYRPFLIFPSAAQPCPDPCFDLAGFLKVQEAAGAGNTGIAEFMTEMVKTQAFRRFCEERIFPNQKDNKRVIFFDESILAKRNRSKFLSKKFDTPFLKDRSLDLNKTFVAPSPDSTNLPLGASYVYPLFPALNPALFSKPRIITPLLIKQTGAAQHGNMRVGKGGVSFGSWQPKQGGGASSSSGSSSSMGVSRSFRDARRLQYLQSSSQEQVVATLWFILYTGIMGENQRADGLDTAFQVLINLRNNGMQVEEEIFPCFLFACGSCNVPERAIDVLREMQNSGYTPDPTTYAALLQVFTMTGDYRGQDALANLKKQGGSGSSSNGGMPSPITAGALVQSLKDKLIKPYKAGGNASMQQRPSQSADAAASSSAADPSSSSPLPPPSLTYYHHPPPPSDPLSPCHSPLPLKIHEIAESDRIKMFRLQFEMMFPGLEVNSDESCPECGTAVEDHQIRAGWTDQSNDYTTKCPKCEERFVARFSVRPKLRPGDNGMGARPGHHYSKSFSQSSQPPTSPAHTTAAVGQQPQQQAAAAPSSPPLPSESEPLSPDSLALLKATQTLSSGGVSATQQRRRESVEREMTRRTLSEPMGSPFQPNEAHLPAAASAAAAAASASAASPSLPSVSISSPPLHSIPSLHTPPILCEYLSPRVLKKELLHLLEVRPARYLCSREFRKNSPALFWNLAWHFTGMCLPIDFLIRLEKKPKRQHSTLSTPTSAATSPVVSPVRRQRRRRSSMSSLSSSLSSIDSFSSASSPGPTSPLNVYERTIAISRASGVGRAFGYGSGGMVSGTGAVGISLGSLLRTRDQSALPPALGEGVAEEEENEEEEEEFADEYGEIEIGEEEEEEELEEPPMLYPPQPVAPAPAPASPAPSPTAKPADPSPPQLPPETTPTSTASTAEVSPSNNVSPPIQEPHFHPTPVEDKEKEKEKKEQQQQQREKEDAHKEEQPERVKSAHQQEELEMPIEDL